MSDPTLPPVSPDGQLSEAGPGAATHAVAAVELTSEQVALYEALITRDGRLANMYFGAIIALKSSANPERVAHAAHSMRELLEKIPRYLRAPIAAAGPNLKARGRELVNQVAIAKKQSKAFDGNVWSGEIDGSLRTMLIKFEAFALGFEQDYPSRREETRIAIRTIDPLSGRLPATIEDTLISEWKAYDEYFKAVSHHGGDANEATFTDQMSRSTQFLLNQFRPPSADTQRMLDEIIMEGERRG